MRSKSAKRMVGKWINVPKRQDFRFVAHRDISRRRSNSVAFGAKRTFSEPHLQNRIYEYAP